MAGKKKEDPSFFAIIPATVRYDKSLNPYARLLYGEITALAKKEGYAWASNQYLANLYQVDRGSISHWIKQLQDKGYIRVELVYDNSKPFVKERRIYIADLNRENPACCAGDPGACPEPPGPQESIGEFSLSADEMHNYSENSNASEGGGDMRHHGGDERQQGVVTDFTRGGDETPRRSLQAINKKAAADRETEKLEKPPPEEETAENVKSLKLHFKNLSPFLVFDEAFYPKAVSYLSFHSLDFEFISWMYEFCLEKAPKNLPGYFFRIFFEKRFVELYRSRPPPVEKTFFACPVCSTKHESALTGCPSCGLDISNRRNPKEIERKKLYYYMQADIKKIYDEEYNSLLESSKNLDFRDRKKLLDDLCKKYGLIV